jgi:hypothetical protein
MFTVIPRKPDDIKLENEYREKIKVLQDEYKTKRSDYDKSLGKYNQLLKKLNNETNNSKIDSIKENIKKLESELNNKPVDTGKVIADDSNVKIKIPKGKKKTESVL